jgi:hypothetical protein
MVSNAVGLALLAQHTYRQFGPIGKIAIGVIGCDRGPLARPIATARGKTRERWIVWRKRFAVLNDSIADLRSFLGLSEWLQRIGGANPGPSSGGYEVLRNFMRRFQF